MYLHLGQYTVVRTDDIVGIFDLENTSVSKATRDLLAKAEKNAQVINVTDKLPKSFVLCQDRKTGEQKIYIRGKNMKLFDLDSPVMRFSP